METNRKKKNIRNKIVKIIPEMNGIRIKLERIIMSNKSMKKDSLLEKSFRYTKKYTDTPSKKM